MAQALGMLEYSSVAFGHQSQDAMLKAADVQLILARSICSGKYMAVVGGDVAAVEASVSAGAVAAEGSVIEELVIPNIHPDLFPALADCTTLEPEEVRALGMLETFSAASIIESADAAAKAAAVKLFRVRVAMALGGKGYLQLTGEVAAVRAAIDAGARMAGKRGMLVGMTVIANPHPALFREYV